MTRKKQPIVRCCACGRSEREFSILGQFFGIQLETFRIPGFDEWLCSDCMHELSTIAREQIYFGDPRLKAVALQARCLTVLLSRDHTWASADVELCDLVDYVEDKLEELRTLTIPESEMHQFLRNAICDWNGTHPHRCALYMEKTGSNTFNMHVKFYVTPGTFREFSAEITASDAGPAMQGGMLPFSVD